MNVLRFHPYACAIAAAAVLVVVGAIAVKSHSSLATPSGVSAWSGTSGALVNSQSAQPETSTTVPTQTASTSTQQEDDQTLPYTPTSQAEQDAQPGADDDTSSAQLQALLTELSHPSAQSSAPAQGASSSIASAYAYIPTGMVSVQGAAQEQYTASQDALYNYGNEAGTVIQQEETNDADAPDVLKDSIQSRSDQTKSAAVAQIGADIAAVGTRLAKISDAGQASSQNSALAQSYEATGGALQQVAAATNQSDSTFVAALQAYDTAANALVKNYVALAVIFSANGVVFAPDDPGSVFTFNAGAGL